MSARPGDLPALTGLRFLAASWVVAFHLTGGRGWGIESGFYGVCLFFVLSGFILTHVHGERKEALDLRAFWRARIARIYPMYALALLAALPLFLQALWLGSGQRLRALVLAPLALQAWSSTAALDWNGPGWSISNEAFFYVLFPVVAPALVRWRRWGPVVAATCWIAGLLVAVAVARVSPEDPTLPGAAQTGEWLTVLKFNPLAHTAEFLLGIATAGIFRRLTDATRRRLGSLDWLFAAAVMLGATFTRIPIAVRHTGLLAPLFAALIASLAVGSGPLARLLGLPWAVRLGEASYGLYLFHAIVWGYALAAGRHLLGIRDNLAIEQLVTAGVSLVGSLVLFRRFEEPMRRRLRAHGPAPAQPVAASPLAGG